MKKIPLLIAIAFFGFITMTSCKKDRICSCTEDGEVEKITYIDATKRQGKANCVSYSFDNGDGTHTKVECKLD